MSELTNPLFDDEKEFLERKKREYERALAADVEDLKDKSMAAGKIAAIGAGAVGGIWLLAKLFGGKKRQGANGASGRAASSESSRKPAQRPNDQATGFAPDDEFYTDGLGRRHRAVAYHKSAAQSAAVFAANPAAAPDQPAHSWDRYRAANPADQGFDNYAPADDLSDDDLSDDGGFGAGFGTAAQSASVRAAASPDPDMIGAEVFANAYAAANTANASNQTKHRQAEAEAAASTGPAARQAAAPLPFAAGAGALAKPAAAPAAPKAAAHSDDPFAEPAPAQPEAVIPPRANGSGTFGRLAGAGIRTFLQSENGRTLVAQASAVGLALVTKQLAKWRSGSQPSADVASAATQPAAPAIASAATSAPAAAPVPAAPAPAAPAAPKPRRAAATNKNADLAAAPAVAPSETAAPRPQNAAPSDDSPAPSPSPA